MIIKTTKPLRNPLVSGSIISKLTSIQDPLNDPNFEITTAQWTQIGQDINGEAAGDQSGTSVALSDDGTILAIGATENDGGGSNSGHIRVYQRDTGAPLGWTQIGQDINGEASGDESGSAIALSSDGLIVAIGAYGNDGNGSSSGHVRVYQRDASVVPLGWTQLGGDIDGEATGDQSGFSVTLSSDGSILAIGANDNDGGGSSSGHVRVYQRDASVVPLGWTQLGGDIDGDSNNQRVGRSVALNANGSIVAIGSRAGANNNSKMWAGHVSVYQRDTGAPLGWTQIGDDIDGEASGDFSAFAIALSDDGSILAIGSNLNDGGGGNSGHVRVYENVGGTWQQLGDDIDGEAGDYSGNYLDLSSDGSIVAIGAYGNDGGGEDSGCVRVYQRDASVVPLGWRQLGPDIDGVRAFDRSARVALNSDGTIVAVGAPLNNNSTGADSGQVRVYELQ